VTLFEPIASSVPNYPFELLVVRKDLIDRNPDAVTRITAAVIEACRFIATDKEGTLEVFRKYSPDTSREVASAAYDGLIALKAFGVDGGMTQENMTAAMKMSVDNKALDKPIPLDVWTDFRFQDAAMKLLGPFKPR
jgi:ABC-type nitrate/sulfonate/bicarbonate transport system substrate-binding protein